jgi:DNA polymerase
LSHLKEAAACCQGCPLFADATQTVFGEGPPDARIVFIGEQPGDEEDRAGRPFVGPAGRLLAELMQEVGLPRDEVYMTNAVKHFGHMVRGRRRIHKKPRRIDVVSCRAWLEGELAAIRPEVAVCLGATAATSLISPAFRISLERGAVWKTDYCERTIATYHPSAILRAASPEAAAEIRAAIIKDLTTAKRIVGPSDLGGT